MAERITQHTHCQICGKAIPLTENLCSEECKQRYSAVLRKRKILMYVMYAAIFIVLFLIILSSGNVS